MKATFKSEDTVIPFQPGSFSHHAIKIKYQILRASCSSSNEINLIEKAMLTAQDIYRHHHHNNDTNHVVLLKLPLQEVRLDETQASIIT